MNPKCKACVCHTTAHAKSVCMAGKNSDGRRALMVFTDYPDYFADNAHKPYALDAGGILDWMFRRMSIDPSLVAYEYTLRCYAKGSLPGTKADRSPCIEECSRWRFASIAKCRPRAIACLGTVSLEAFTGKTQIGDFVGRRIRAWEPVVRDHVEEVWIGYSIAYCLVSPSDTPSVFRTLYMAAEEAGLKPKINPEVPPFRWRDLK